MEPLKEESGPTEDDEIPSDEEVPNEEAPGVDKLPPEIDPPVGGGYVVGGFAGV